jgi:RHS repeat-associated protein
MGAPKKQIPISFEYDAKSRRIGKKLWNNLTFNGTPALEQKFVYDGWNLIGVLNSLFALQTSFYWGTDLSGSMQGAGGVGGLLELNDSVSGVHFVAYDGNGDVSALVKAADGTVSAMYEYGPFGEVLRATGPMAKANPFRFSTKYQDDETDLVYYGYRSYSASTGRWLSRDPLGEKASVNLNGFVQNEPTILADDIGLRIIVISFPPLPPIGLPPVSIPIPLPIPPPPYLGPGDTLPSDFNGFALCQRPFFEEGFVDKCLNRCGQGHKFLGQVSDGKVTAGYGFYPTSGVTAEKTLTCPRAATCKRTSSPLRYGSGGSAGVTGTSATDAQILDCIGSRPRLGPYNAPWNDCRHWVAQAATDCGLDCGQ